MARPHLTHTLSSCWAPENNSVVTSSRASVPSSGSLADHLRSVLPSQDGQTINYALGTLEFRKQRNRKRTRTGEFVWSDEADLIFTLALVSWTSNRSVRVGTRRANFLQQFLGRNGVTKTRKQIASRLQVLKGEWRATPYLSLLDDPDRPGMSKLYRTASPSPSPSPSVESERTERSNPRPLSSSNPSPISATSPFGEKPGLSVDSMPEEKPYFEAPPFSPLSVVQDDGFSSKRSFHDPHLQRHDFTAPEAPLQVVSHQLQLHAPTALLPGAFRPPFPRPVHSVPGIPAIHTPRTYPHAPCVQQEPHTWNGALGGSFRQSRPFAY